MAKDKKKEKEPEAEEKEDEKEKPKDKDAKEEAPQEGSEEEGGAPAEIEPKKSKKKIIIIGILALVVLLGGSAGVYFSGVLSKHEDKSSAVELGPDGKPLEKPVYYTLPDFLVNLNVGGKQTSFLKTVIILEVAHQADVAQIDANLPRLTDAMNTYLRELRPSDLSGSAGIQRLREELLLRINKVMAPTKINDVLFKEIVVQ